MLLLIWIVAILVALTLYFKQVYSRFSRHGVKNPPVVPFMGNMASPVLCLENFTDYFSRLYNSYPGERFFGVFHFVTSAVVIKDLELLKNIAVKDFEHFLDHHVFINEESDSFFGRNLFSLKGQEWKEMRATLSPAFTSSKIRLMVPFMVEVGEQMVKSLKMKLKSSEVDYIDLESKDLATRYANDVIASCAFGLKVDSHINEDNEFYMMGKTATTFDFKVLLKFFASFAFPTVMKKMKFSIFDDKTKMFFINLVLNTMADREERGVYRPDMIQLLMDVKKGSLAHDEKTSTDADAGFATVEESAIGKKTINRVWSDNDLIAQAMLFFFAGFDTVATGMTFTLYELAINPDVQEKLVQEIRETDAKNGGKFDYNTIQHMKYMDMVVSEALRLWTPVVAANRLCVKDYNMGKPNTRAAKDFILRKGEAVLISTHGIHRNPDYFPNPLKFDPERFSDENKHNIKPLTYIPFGLGPRNCIGSRFALCEIKVMIYQLLQHMEVSPCEKTVIPPKLSNELIGLRMKGGHWLRFKMRK